MQQTITLQGQNVMLVTLPTAIAPKMVEFTATDRVAVVRSIFTGQTQAQSWAGADELAAKVTFPPLKTAQAAQLKAFLMQMRGMLCAVQLGDYDAQNPQGTPAGTPLVDGTATTNNAFGATSLVTKGWSASHSNLLLPGDAIQVGYRMYYALDAVNSDTNGAATINVWPSLRETPADGTAIVTSGAKALFRLDSNSRGWSLGVGKITTLSTFGLVEYR